MFLAAVVTQMSRQMKTTQWILRITKTQQVRTGKKGGDKRGKKEERKKDKNERSTKADRK